jgi:hypothetical protein
MLSIEIVSYFLFDLRFREREFEDDERKFVKLSFQVNFLNNFYTY